MDNLKIKVSNENESKEAQELFFDLGYKWIDIGAVYYKISPSFNYITAYCEGKTLAQGHGLDAKREITIPQLKDMVVLNRNDVGDATHINFRTNTPFLVQGSKEYFYLNNKWILSDCANDLKPIKKKEMKEYLLKTDDGYKLITAENAEGEGVIEVPDGVEILKYFHGDSGLCFYRNKFSEIWQDEINPPHWGKVPDIWVDGIIKGGELLWQRETINDKVASAEEYRQSETEYLMQGKNGERLIESIKEFNQTEHGKDFGDFKLIDSEQLPFNTDMEDFAFNPVELMRTANEIADAALVHIKERANTYDQSGGERSAAKTALAFNAITGKDLTESEVWLLLQLLKDVRQWSRESYHQDSAEDCIAYAALKAESLERNR